MNKTFASSIVLALLTASYAQAGVTLTAPAGLADGTKFRFLFVTTNKTTATSSDITTYDAFVNNQADGATYNGSVVSWKALGSTETVNARDNVGGFGSNAAIYLVNGTKIAQDMTTSAGGLWGGSILSAANRTISGTTAFGTVWTGSFRDGTALINDRGNFALGSVGTPAFGYSTILSDWLNFATMGGASLNRMYGVSQEFTVGDIPAPGALALLGLAGMSRARRRA